MHSICRLALCRGRAAGQLLKQKSKYAVSRTTGRDIQLFLERSFQTSLTVVYLRFQKPYEADWN
jgi:hypothetical protein